jgi:hypothetical protein
MASAPQRETEEQLKADDFPLRAEQEQVKAQDGKPIARTESEQMAADLAERLNCEEHRREEDKWSA